LGLRLEGEGEGEGEKTMKNEKMKKQSRASLYRKDKSLSKRLGYHDEDHYKNCINVPNRKHGLMNLTN
jgi:hypothetical protein